MRTRGWLRSPAAQRLVGIARGVEPRMTATGWTRTCAGTKPVRTLRDLPRGFDLLPDPASLAGEELVYVDVRGSDRHDQLERTPRPESHESRHGPSSRLRHSSPPWPQPLPHGDDSAAVREIAHFELGAVDPRSEFALEEQTPALRGHPPMRYSPGSSELAHGGRRAVEDPRALLRGQVRRHDRRRSRRKSNPPSPLNTLHLVSCAYNARTPLWPSRSRRKS